jgi:hypothetical protein
MENNLFNPCIFNHKISIKINELNNIKKIIDLLNIKVKDLENKCFEYGYIKENSIQILNYSQGYLNPIIFVPFIEYKITCKADIFIPNINDIYLATVNCINKIGIKCTIPYKNKKNTYNPINIIISKHNQKLENINNLKRGDLIYIKILGYKFSLLSTCINTIANIVSKTEINNIKNISKIINNLCNINFDCIIETSKFNKYKNILKFILNKNEFTDKELFIYNFIDINNIKYNTKNIIDTFNEYIEQNKNINENTIESDILYEYNETEETDLNEDMEEELETLNDDDIKNIFDNSENSDIDEDEITNIIEEEEDEEDDEEEEEEENDNNEKKKCSK